MGRSRLVRPLLGAVLTAACFWGCAAFAQASPPVTAPSPPANESPQPQPNAIAPLPCIQPPPLASWEDYDGKFKKVVGVFARKLERKSVHRPHYKPGELICTLELKDKFVLFFQETIDPVTLLGVGFNAGIGQAENTDPSFHQGALGYAKRFGAGEADQASSQFFKDFAYPTIFSQDPRYFRMAHGSGGRRFLHAIGHVFVAYREDGTHMFNVSEWLGTSSAVVLANVYHPDNRRGFSPAARRVGYAVLNDVAFNVLREFFPEFAHKCKLPFKDEYDTGSSNATAAPQKLSN